MRGCEAFADVEEDGVDLEDVVEVGFGAGAPFEDFVLVAGYFVAFFAWGLLVRLESVGCCRRVISVPFFNRTRATFVSFIWFEGCRYLLVRVEVRVVTWGSPGLFLQAF